mmetsp:Transcript_78648/g.163514  ORF Transcript_78648/g.163514 Transcript_78648/m.163514 type:complete len:351 (+) Transcript_78648:548-1600(+)
MIFGIIYHCSRSHHRAANRLAPRLHLEKRLVRFESMQHLELVVVEVLEPRLLELLLCWRGDLRCKELESCLRPLPLAHGVDHHRKESHVPIHAQGNEDLADFGTIFFLADLCLVECFRVATLLALQVVLQKLKQVLHGLLEFLDVHFLLGLRGTEDFALERGDEVKHLHQFLMFRLDGFVHWPLDDSFDPGIVDLLLTVMVMMDACSIVLGDVLEKCLGLPFSSGRSIICFQHFPQLLVPPTDAFMWNEDGFVLPCLGSLDDPGRRSFELRPCEGGSQSIGDRGRSVRLQGGKDLKLVLVKVLQPRLLELLLHWRRNLRRQEFECLLGTLPLTHGVDHHREKAHVAVHSH